MKFTAIWRLMTCKGFFLVTVYKDHLQTTVKVDKEDVPDVLNYIDDQLDAQIGVEEVKNLL